MGYTLAWLYRGAPAIAYVKSGLHLTSKQMTDLTERVHRESEAREYHEFYLIIDIEKTKRLGHTISMKFAIWGARKTDNLRQCIIIAPHSEKWDKVYRIMNDTNHPFRFSSSLNQAINYIVRVNDIPNPDMQRIKNLVKARIAVFT